MAEAKHTYLSFKIGAETFAVNVSKVMEIREYQAPKALPQTLPYVSGVVEYQDEVLPLIDTGIKFGMAPVVLSAATCIVVLQLENTDLGKIYRVAVLVDNVADVMEAELEDMKTIGDDYRPDYISTTLSYKDEFVYILNADAVFNQKEVVAIQEYLQKNQEKN